MKTCHSFSVSTKQPILTLLRWLCGADWSLNRVKVWRWHNGTPLVGDAPKVLCSEFGDGEVGIAWPQCRPQSHRTLLGSACLSQTNQHNHTSWLVTHAGQRPSNSSVWPAWTQAVYLRTVLPQADKQNKPFGISREGLASFSCHFLTNVAHLRGNSRGKQHSDSTEVLTHKCADLLFV